MARSVVVLVVLGLVLAGCSGSDGAADIGSSDGTVASSDAGAADTAAGGTSDDTTSGEGTDDAGPGWGADGGAGDEDAGPAEDASGSEDVAPSDDSSEPVTGELPPSQPLDVPEGGFGVGYTRLEVTYTPTTFTEPRTLEVAVWYPTTDTGGTSTTYLATIPRPDVITDASVAGPALPTVVFSHGNNGIETQSYFFTEELAARGWLVIAPRHTGNSFMDFSQEQFPIMFMWRPMDITATLDAVADLPEDHPLAGAMSADIVAAGHSFGGYTSLTVGGATLDAVAIDVACASNPEACGDLWTDERRDLVVEGFADARIDAVIPMAPWRVGGVMPTDGTDTVPHPTLLITAALDETTPNGVDGDPIWEGLAHGDNRRIDFTTAGHFTFANACEFGILEGDGCGPGFIPTEEAFVIVNDYGIAFAEHHILGVDHSGLLDGVDPPAPEDTVLSVP